MFALTYKLYLSIFLELDLFDMIQTGDQYHHTFSFSQKDVERFAEVTGDNNPLHLDAAYAEKTIFKQPIMHGFLGSSIFSKVFGTLFPGQGTIYLKQSMEFLRPMLANIEYEAVFTVITVNREKHTAEVETVIREKDTEKVTTRGAATIMHREKL